MKTLLQTLCLALFAASLAHGEEYIDLGSSANDGTGDKMRAAGIKINTNAFALGRLIERAITNSETSRTLFVSTNGNNATAEMGQRHKPWGTVSNALEAATSLGATRVLIGPGTWPITLRTWRMPRGVTLEVESPGDTIITNTLTLSAFGPAIVLADNCTLINVTVLCDSADEEHRAPIGVNSDFTQAGATNVLIRGMRSYAWSDGLYLTHTSRCVIRIEDSYFESGDDLFVQARTNHSVTIDRAS